MGHRWYYADAGNASVGLMVCTACRKPITHGKFRYRDTEEAYLPQHRACSEADPKWAEMDREAAERRDWAERRLAAARAFVHEWGDTPLDDILDSRMGA